MIDEGKIKSTYWWYDPGQSFVGIDARVRSAKQAARYYPGWSLTTGMMYLVLIGAEWISSTLSFVDFPHTWDVSAVLSNLFILFKNFLKKVHLSERSVCSSAPEITSEHLLDFCDSLNTWAKIERLEKKFKNSQSGFSSVTPCSSA